MSDFALRAPVPVLYGERPQKPKKQLDEQAARLFSPLKLLGAELRAKRLARVVPRVEALDEEMRTLSDEALRARARKIGQALRRDGDFSMDTVAPAFAVIREVSGRLSGRRHYGVQMIGAYAMLRGNLAQMATGEGKTLTAALAAATAALAGLPTHVVTVNDYLAKRDAELTEPIYRYLGFSVGVVVSGQKTEERQAAYACDITYCTNKELTFDYLRDRIVLGQRGSNLQLKLEATESAKARTSELRLRGLHFAIVDEADSVLVDEARTPLVISREEKGQVSAETATQALMLAADLVEGTDYHLNVEQRRVQLTAQGRDRVEEFARDRGVEWRGVVVREELARQALSALLLFHKGEQYLLREGKVQIVDEHTGRVMPDRAWSDGLHQIIEVKEGCKPSARRETIARMTYQRFFRRYRRLAGMTGTGRHVAAEFWSVYRLPVVQVPTHRPRQRIDLGDRVLLNDETKWRLVIERVAALNAKGVPILLGTRSVASALTASERLTAVGLDHEIVSAAQDSTEAAVVARAGERGAITVATNMAGRGTDIHVADEIETLGGLHVIMVERHEARRIDDQLAGRSGRQGQKGCFQAILSLDDPILDFALSQSMRKLCRLAPARLGEMPARLLLRHAQKRAERIHARMRRDLLKSDENQIKTLAFTGRAE